MAPTRSTGDGTLRFAIGREEIVVRRAYELVSIVNDIMIAGWFIAGSILFFSASTTTLGTWFFLVGSVQLLIRPAIRLARHVHLRRIGRGAPVEASHDF